MKRNRGLTTEIMLVQLILAVVYFGICCGCAHSIAWMGWGVELPLVPTLALGFVGLFTAWPVPVWVIFFVATYFHVVPLFGAAHMVK